MPWGNILVKILVPLAIGTLILILILILSGEPTIVNTELTQQSEQQIVPALGLEEFGGQGDKPLTMFGKGFRGGTSAIVWLDQNQNGKRDPGEIVLVTVPIANSCDCFNATFVVTVPPSSAGRCTGCRSAPVR